MTRKTKVSKTKLLFTILSIVLFTVVLVNVDAFWSSAEDATVPVNADFLWVEEPDVGINPDNITLSDNGEESPVVSYIVQEGDSLEKISKEFWVPIKDLQRLNKIKDQPKVGQKLVVSDNEEGILYVVEKERSLKLFAEFYRLNIDDLMTFNYFSDDSEILYPGQELFINVTEQRAYDIGLLEKAQPVLPKDEVAKPKTAKKTATYTKGAVVYTNGGSASAVNPGSAKSAIIRQWYYNPKISNGFAVGYCTWYAAMKAPGIFSYTSDTKQERPFGGNARDWYANAKAAWYNVGSTPRAWAIIVYRQLRSYAGHVGIVKEYHPDSWEMIIEDMNYAGKYIVTQRWENANRDGIVGYIYP